MHWVVGKLEVDFQSRQFALSHKKRIHNHLFDSLYNMGHLIRDIEDWHPDNMLHC